MYYKLGYFRKSFVKGNNIHIYLHIVELVYIT